MDWLEANGFPPGKEMTNKAHPICIYFVQRKSEHLTWVGHLCKMAALGYSLGIDTVLIPDTPPDNAPPELAYPGVWVEYSDKSLQSVGLLKGE